MQILKLLKLLIQHRRITVPSILHYLFVSLVYTVVFTGALYCIYNDTEIPVWGKIIYVGPLVFSIFVLNMIFESIKRDLNVFVKYIEENKKEQ